MTLLEMIDKAVGKKGVFRIPSWWMHKILSTITTELEGTIPLPHDFNDDFNEDFAI